MKATSATAASLILLGLVLPPAAGVRAQPPKADPPRSEANALAKEDDEAIRKVVAGRVEALNGHDMKALAKLFREDAEWINIAGMHWRGRDSIIAANEAFLHTVFKDDRLTLDAVETRSLGAGCAVAVATIAHAEFKAPTGKVIPSTHNRVTHVLAKGPDGWKIVHGHNTQVDAESAKHDPINKPTK